MVISKLAIEPYQEEVGESYMNPKQLNHFKRLLIAWKNQLMSGAQNTKTSIHDDSKSITDANDLASQEEQMTHLLRKGEREAKLFNRIINVISSIETGNYGKCQTCKCNIGILRLEARPVANKCIDCKIIEEEEESIY